MNRCMYTAQRSIETDLRQLVRMTVSSKLDAALLVRHPVVRERVRLDALSGYVHVAVIMTCTVEVSKRFSHICIE